MCPRIIHCNRIHILSSTSEADDSKLLDLSLTTTDQADDSVLLDLTPPTTQDADDSLLLDLSGPADSGRADSELVNASHAPISLAPISLAPNASSDRSELEPNMASYTERVQSSPDSYESFLVYLDESVDRVTVDQSLSDDQLLHEVDQAIDQAEAKSRQLQSKPPVADVPLAGLYSISLSVVEEYMML